MQNNVQNTILFPRIVLSVHRLAPEGCIKKTTKVATYGDKNEKTFKFISYTDVTQSKKKNKIIMKLNGERKRKRKHKNNSLCAINST